MCNVIKITHLIHSYNVTFYCSDMKPIYQIYENSLHNLVTIDKTVKTHPSTGWSLIYTIIRPTIPVHQWLCISIKWQFCQLSAVFQHPVELRLWSAEIIINHMSCWIALNNPKWVTSLGWESSDSDLDRYVYIIPDIHW